MTEAEIILKLIETADPSDSGRLDEIDARVWCLIDGIDFDKTLRIPWAGGQSLLYDSYGVQTVPRFTRSRATC